MNLTVQYKLTFINARQLAENEWYLTRRKPGETSCFPFGGAIGEKKFADAEDAIIAGMKVIDAEVEKAAAERTAERALVSSLKAKGFDVYPGHT